MKQLIKFSALLLLTLAVFIGCKHAPEDNSTKKAGLFDYKTITTVDMEKTDFNSTTYPLADGEWVYKGIEEFIGTGIYVEEITFTKTGTTYKITNATYYMEASGDYAYGNISDSDKASYEAKLPTNEGFFDNFKKSQVQYLKTNADKTRFFVYAEGLTTRDGNESAYKANYYLMKK